MVVERSGGRLVLRRLLRAGKHAPPSRKTIQDATPRQPSRQCHATWIVVICVCGAVHTGLLTSGPRRAVRARRTVRWHAVVGP